MKQVDTVPTTGRFVAVWEEEGCPECGYFSWGLYDHVRALWQYKNDEHCRKVQPKEILKLDEVKIFIGAEEEDE